jgi:sugar lactone lactonase YvrE
MKRVRPKKKQKAASPAKLLLTLGLFGALAVLLMFLAFCRLANDAPVIYAEIRTLAGLPEGEDKGVFAEPFGLTFDRSGYLYVSDGEAGKIWRVTTSGTASLVTDKLHTPSSMAFSKDGDLLVADTGSHTIKQVNVSNGEVAAFAGTSDKPGFADGTADSAMFNGPIGIAVDANGRVFVADTYNDRIRMIENDKVTTFAGGESGFTDAIGAKAKFDTPTGLAFLPNGDLLVADSGNRRVRRVTNEGKVSTFAGSGEAGTKDGEPTASTFVEPAALAVDRFGVVYVSDAAANGIRVVGRRQTPLVETFVRGGRGFADGKLAFAQMNRPNALAIDQTGNLFVADSDNLVVRVLQSDAAGYGEPASAEKIGKMGLSSEEIRKMIAPRWCYNPPDNKREIAGTLGEIRGEIGSGEAAWFHNGLDIVGGYGETALFIHDEKVLRPRSVQEFATKRELIRLPLLGYVHLRLGRDKDDRPFEDTRFIWHKDANGKIVGLRVRRGTIFKTSEAIGTLNSMNHVHLIAGRSGSEMNALRALQLPGIADGIAPVIEKVGFFAENWQPLSETNPPGERMNLSGKIRIVAKAYDRMDGNAERRRLGVFRLGYSVLNGDGTRVTGFADKETTISLGGLPESDGAVALVYAPGSKSGAAGETIFNYIVTNQVKDGVAKEGFLDATILRPGNYTVRVTASDFFGNVAEKDVPVVVQ